MSRVYHVNRMSVVTAVLTKVARISRVPRLVSKLGRVALVSMLATLLAAPAHSETNSSHPEIIGRIKTVAGDASVLRGDKRLTASSGMVLANTDTLVTGADGGLGITFVDNTRFALGPNTEIRVDTFAFNPTTHEGEFVSSVKRGRLSVISGRIAKSGVDAMKVRTPSRILGVRGTEFLIKVTP